MIIAYIGLFHFSASYVRNLSYADYHFKFKNTTSVRFALSVVLMYTGIGAIFHNYVGIIPFLGGVFSKSIVSSLLF